MVLMLCIVSCEILLADFEARKFISADGQKVISAVPVGYDQNAMVVFLKMPSGQLQQVQISKFSIEDQLFIEDNKQQLSIMLAFLKMPKEIQSRFYDGLRQELVRTHKAPPGSSAALAKFLARLKATQNPDGSWVEGKKVSMTAMALLVYMAEGETPLDEDYGDAVTRAIAYLTNVAVKNGGKLADDVKDKHWPYQHAMATLALAEAYTICTTLGINFPKLKEATKMAGNWILNHQHTSGSWDYGYDMSGARGGDTSLAMWHVQAMRVCIMTGMWKMSEFVGSVRKALAYVKKNQNSNGGIGYTSPNAYGDTGFTLTGAGMYAFQMWYKPHDPVVRKRVKYISKNARFKYNTEHADLYRQYYHALAMKHRGGKDWMGYKNMLGNQLIENQAEDGSWKNVGGGAKILGIASTYQGESEFATHFRSCLCAFILQVPYRYDWNAVRVPMGFGG